MRFTNFAIFFKFFAVCINFLWKIFFNFIMNTIINKKIINIIFC